MKPATRTPVSNKTTDNDDSADRILKIVHGLQQEVVEAQETTRKEVTRSLLSRFHIEISQLQALLIIACARPSLKTKG
jgi:hypothetical protein